MTIPKHIYQIALGKAYRNQIPLDDIRSKLISANPEYSYTLYTESECEELLSHAEFAHMKPIYNQCECPQHKSDIIRYIILYLYGGIYIDIDLQLLVSLDEILCKASYPKCIYTIGTHIDTKEICNGLLFSEPRNPVFLEALDSIAQYPNPEDYGANVKSLYAILERRHGTPAKYMRTDDCYFMQELGESEKYWICMENDETQICLTNGHNEPNLYLTYNNESLTDGAGAQIQRIITLFMICLKHGIKYIHSPIHRITYQGLQNLERDAEEATLINKFNALFALPSAECSYSNIYVLDTVLTDDLLEHFKDISRNKSTIVSVALPHDELIPFNYKIGYPWISNTLSEPLRIAIHIRRGELYIVDSHRMLPNSYYISCMNALCTLFADRAYEFHIYSEDVQKEVEITPEHKALQGRFETPVLLTPSDNHWEDFAGFANLHWHINECPVQTLQDLVNSDILLASRSSFSYVAGLLKQKGVTIFHPFWHPLDPEWISATSGDDILANADRIHQYIKP